MDDLISRKMVLALPRNKVRSLRTYEVVEETINVTDIEHLPSAQAERETAKFIRWMECKKTDNYISYTPHCKCSKCGIEFLITNIKYCYMCGARMEENNEAD